MYKVYFMEQYFTFSPTELETVTSGTKLLESNGRYFLSSCIKKPKSCKAFIITKAVLVELLQHFKIISLNLQTSAAKPIK